MKGWNTQRAIEFATRLEENEAVMAEGAAMMATLQEYGLEWGDQTDVLLMLPEGKWWEHDARAAPRKEQ